MRVVFAHLPRSGFRNTVNENLRVACHAVWKAMGFPFEASRGSPWAENHGGDDWTIERLAEASGLRARVVRLEGDWWRVDHGPILAFSVKDAAPLALTWRLWGGYRVFDPLTAASWIVSSESVGQLTECAYVFHLRSPEPAMSANLVRRRVMNRPIEIVLGLAGGTASALLLSLPPTIAIWTVLFFALPGGNHALLLQATAALTAAMGFAIWFRAIQTEAVARIGAGLEAELQGSLMDAALSPSAGVIQKIPSRRHGEAIVKAPLLYAQSAEQAIHALPPLLCAAAFMSLVFLIDGGLGLATAGVLALYLVILMPVVWLRIAKTRECEERRAKAREVLSQIVNGMAKIQGTGTEDVFSASWLKIHADKTAAERRQALAAAAEQGLFAAIPLLCAAMALHWCLATSDACHPTPFLMLTASAASVMAAAFFSAAARAAVEMAARWALAGNALPRLGKDVGNREQGSGFRVQETPNTATRAVDIDTPWKVELRDVSFSHAADSPCVLRNVSLTIDPGSFVVVRGPSGCGKSSLAKLLIGLETPTGGEILFNDARMDQIEWRTFRTRVAGVSQSMRMEPGTLLTTIAGMRNDLTTEEAWEAARLAECDADIAAMPSGMATRVAAGGRLFSGGQIQRFHLASVFALKTARLIVLDEALAAIDPVMRQRIIGRLKKLNATVILVSHSLEDAALADLVLTPQEGRLAFPAHPASAHEA